MHIIHRYVQQGLYTPPGAVGLLIGTFPSVLVKQAYGRMRPNDVDFFYGSAENNLWRDFSAIYNVSLLQENSAAAVEQRLQLLEQLRLAITDIVASTFTTGGATDTSLQNIELNPGIVQLLHNHPSINRLYFTSGSGKVNAESLTLKLLKESGSVTNVQIISKTTPRQRQFVFAGNNGRRIITATTLYSPSPLAEQWGGVTPEKRQQQYRSILPPLPH